MHPTDRWMDENANSYHFSWIGDAVIRWMDDNSDTLTTSVEIGEAVKIPQYKLKEKHKTKKHAAFT